jgi:hypothetical protein
MRGAAPSTLRRGSQIIAPSVDAPLGSRPSRSLFARVRPPCPHGRQGRARRPRSQIEFFRGQRLSTGTSIILTRLTGDIAALAMSLALGACGVAPESLPSLRGQANVSFALAKRGSNPDRAAYRLRLNCLAAARNDDEGGPAPTPERRHPLYRILFIRQKTG